jgi:hypothetical protein
MSASFPDVVSGSDPSPSMRSQVQWLVVGEQANVASFYHPKVTGRLKFQIAQVLANDGAVCSCWRTEIQNLPFLI